MPGVTRPIRSAGVRCHSRATTSARACGSFGVGTCRVSCRSPCGLTRPNLMAVPPTSTPRARTGGSVISGKVNGPGEVPRGVRVQAARLGPGDGEAVQQNQMRQGVQIAGDQLGPGGGDVVG